MDSDNNQQQPQQLEQQQQQQQQKHKTVAEERAELERQELEAPLCKPSKDVYLKLLILYLMENELSQAKILWNRIPLEVRNDEPELDKVWRVGQALFERDPPKVHEAIKKQEWCQSTKSLIDRLQEIVRKLYTDNISSAYVSISPKDCAEILGFDSADSVIEYTANTRGWTFDPTSSMILIAEDASGASDGANPDDGSIDAQEKLKKLTDLVAFLEN